MDLVKGKDVLINRTQMLDIANEFNFFISLNTIHRWANEPDFPLVAGKKGKSFLYLKSDFQLFLEKRKKRMQLNH